MIDWKQWLPRARLAGMALSLCAMGSHAAAASTTEPAYPLRAAAVQAFCAEGDHPDALAKLVGLGTQADAANRAWATTLVLAIRDGALTCDSHGGAVITQKEGHVDAVTLAPAQAAPAGTPYVPTIVMMRKLAVATAEMDLFSKQRDLREKAAAQVSKFFMLLDPDILRRAIQRQGDADIKATLALAMAKRGLYSSDKKEQLGAIEALGGVPSESSRTLLTDYLANQQVQANPLLADAAKTALRSIDQWLAIGNGLSILFSGLSYAGILLLTAIGLSIIFGLMGVINLAHGEFIMLGAYATYLVEHLMRVYAPSMFGAYIFVAIPVAFVACGLFGVLLEYCVIRFLYRRPLETLLATWAVSIAIIKLVQLVFGSQNVEFITPSFLNGGAQVVGGFFVTYNRLFAIGFSLAVFLATYAVIRTTRIGLLMRATTQNRDMAKCLGVPAQRIDRLAFAMGAGLAGLAGVVLTQIASVNPFMGAGFVIDAFMVVVLGGAGSLVGTAVSSLALGEINQFIEPFYGAVAAKVAVLLIIVLIIQKRPNGLFTVKTRG
ncbi:MAG: urea ABC transporter permease subunit UrtB [Thiomonas sp.]|uniref:Putative branched-chain amino acid transport system, permease component n=1 Tax=mine drainage metagenome TaxID=410659 RepID=E6PK50_9ZZZZ